MSAAEPPRTEIDLDEAQQIIDALERDLARARAGEGDVETLRREVEALREVLAAEQPHHGHVHDSLHRVMTTLENAGEAIYEDAVKVGDYVTRIGRLLGL